MKETHGYLDLGYFLEITETSSSINHLFNHKKQSQNLQ